MPGRIVSLVTGEYYHICNRGIDRRDIFETIKDWKYFIQAMNYYKYVDIPMKLSLLNGISNERRAQILESLKLSPRYVSIIAYCLMPNHFHLLLKQDTKDGISKYASVIQNSYTRYFNTKHEKTGQLVNKNFRSKHIETEEQLIHVVRYIHLNPLTGAVIKESEDLVSYPWSSFPEYLNLPYTQSLCEKDEVLKLSSRDYLSFVTDQADYQKKLHIIKHLEL